MDGRVVGFVLTLFLVGLNADDDQLKVVKAVEICRFCKCTDGAVDCQYQNITTFFKKEQWELLKDLKPTNVDLSDNFFTNITGIAELPIEILNLSRSRVEWIENGSFKNLKQLRVLDLSHNRLTAAKLSPHAFEGNYSPEEYEPLPPMRVLNLAYNDLHSLNSDLFEHLPELTELDLSGNPLGIIDHVTVIAISSLPMLKVLRMRSCEIKDIPDKMLHTPRYLERLDLSDNLLTTVPQSDLLEAKWLGILGYLYTMSRVLLLEVHVHIGYSYKTLFQELQETKNLLFLNLNQNPIKELDVTSEDNPGFPRLRKLQELHMCNMAQLRRIGAGSLSGLESLSKLHLSLNPRLTEIDAKALARADDVGETYVWPPIKELYLHSNNLSEIDSNLIARWDLVDAIDVSNNPFMCDCTTQWMVDILVPIVEGTKANSSAMVCHEPIEMRPFTMKHLHDIHRTMRCVDKYGHRPERDGAILMGTLIGVLLSVPIMLSLMLLWRRGYFACIGIRGPVDVSRAFYKRAPGDDNFVYNNN